MSPSVVIYYLLLSTVEGDLQLYRLADDGVLGEC